MGTFFNLESPFFQFMNKIGNMIIITILWIIGCIPIVTIGTSTAAMYYATVKVTRKETGYITKEFFRAYKMNLKNGILLTLVWLLVAAILTLDRLYVNSLESIQGTILIVIYNFMLIASISVIMYLFPNMSRFTMSKKDLLKLSFFMSVKHLPTTICLVVMFAATVISIYLIPVLIIILPGVTCYLDSFFLERILLKYMAKSDDSEEEDKWYYQ